MATSADHLRMRASHCRVMAKNVRESSIKRIHNELADRYIRQAEAAKNNTAADLVEGTGGSVRQGVSGAHP